MQLQMTKGEIIASYNEAKNKKTQINILADLNLCAPKDIVYVLREAGVELPKQYQKKAYKKQAPASSPAPAEKEEASTTAGQETAPGVALSLAPAEKEETSTTAGQETAPGVALSQTDAAARADDTPGPYKAEADRLLALAGSLSALTTVGLIAKKIRLRMPHESAEDVVKYISAVLDLYRAIVDDLSELEGVGK